MMNAYMLSLSTMKQKAKNYLWIGVHAQSPAAALGGPAPNCANPAFRVGIEPCHQPHSLSQPIQPERGRSGQCFGVRKAVIHVHQNTR